MVANDWWWECWTVFLFHHGDVGALFSCLSNSWFLGCLGLFVFTGILAMVLQDRFGAWPTNGIAAGFLGFAGLCVLALRGDTDLGILAAIYLTAVIWLTDTGAFFAGRQFGGKKLAPIISPSKTWSGAIGGLLFGTLAGTLVWGLGTTSPIWIGLLISAAISASAQIGDLCESALKRHFAIKDSGDIIPGHGGILDRISFLRCLSDPL